MIEKLNCYNGSLLLISLTVKHTVAGASRCARRNGVTEEAVSKN